MMRPRLLVVCLLAPMLGSCVEYMRHEVDEPLADGVIARLQTGEALGDCLRELGAPNRVYEYRGDGAALLWSWRDSDAWHLTASLPLQDNVSVSFDYDLGDTDAQGCMLWFGPDLRLEHWRRGRVGDLLPGRSRPVAPDSASTEKTGG